VRACVMIASLTSATSQPVDSSGAAARVSSSRARWNVGTRSPANRLPNQDPASRARASASVCLATGPDPFVVRSTVSSWMTTMPPSLVVWRSSSRWSAPISMARSKAARVFSGV